MALLEEKKGLLFSDRYGIIVLYENTCRAETTAFFFFGPTLLSSLFCPNPITIFSFCEALECKSRNYVGQNVLIMRATHSFFEVIMAHFVLGLISWRISARKPARTRLEKGFEAFLRRNFCLIMCPCR